MAVVIAAAAVVPVRERSEQAPRSPRAAAAVAEAAVPRLGLVWGRLRGWERAGAGWRIVWQPAHGAWVVHAWVPDGAGEIGWWLDVAPWLPGARLSHAAASLLAASAAEPLPAERIGRRDWLIGERRLFGALAGGRRVPAPPRQQGPIWGAVLAGLVFAGAVGRALVPALVAAGWRRLVGWTAGVTILALPVLTPLAGRRFEVGVRPWVAEAVFVVVAAMALVAVAVAAVRYPAGRGRARGAVLACALAAGVLAGRITPAPWCAELAGLQARTVAWLALAVLGGWLAGLAGEGLRQLVAPFGRASRVVLLPFAGAVAVTAGMWMGPAVAIVGAAAGGRGQGTPVGIASIAGWLVGATWATCAWSGALRDSLLLLLVCSALAVVATLADQRMPQAA